jgi:hypothetical protein
MHTPFLTVLRLASFALLICARVKLGPAISIDTLYIDICVAIYMYLNIQNMYIYILMILKEKKS